MVNSPLMRPFFIGGVALGVPSIPMTSLKEIHAEGEFMMGKYFRQGLVTHFPNLCIDTK